MCHCGLGTGQCVLVIIKLRTCLGVTSRQTRTCSAHWPLHSFSGHLGGSFITNLTQENAENEHIALQCTKLSCHHPCEPSSGTGAAAQAGAAARLSQLLPGLLSLAQALSCLGPSWVLPRPFWELFVPFPLWLMGQELEAIAEPLPNQSWGKAAVQILLRLVLFMLVLSSWISGSHPVSCGSAGVSPQTQTGSLQLFLNGLCSLQTPLSPSSSSSFADIFSLLVLNKNRSVVSNLLCNDFTIFCQT